ncbi:MULTISPECIES: hypothetical protein [unclassified Candidatus Tisiphia]|uniref:hypothetical protein n=1 Tax=unclassified Candidatus Tisiphia TaxID=2996318 RepID=UPI0035C92962
MRIRDFINEKIQKIEELAQYKEFTTSVYMVYAGFKRIEKFILHNGQERIFKEKIIPCGNRASGSAEEIFLGTSYDSENRIFTPLNEALNAITQVLDIIPQITSYQSSNSSYATQNSQKSQEVARKNQEVYQKNQEIAQKNREITEVQQKIAGLQTQESSLQSQVNSFCKL